jgi:hypothetical protein
MKFYSKSRRSYGSVWFSHHRRVIRKLVVGKGDVLEPYVSSESSDSDYIDDSDSSSSLGYDSDDDNHAPKAFGGFTSYLKSPIGGGKPHAEANSTTNKVWGFFKYLRIPFPDDEISLINAFKARVISGGLFRISKWVSQRTRLHGIAPGTQANHLDALLAFGTYCGTTEVGCNIKLTSFVAVVQNLRRQARKLQKKRSAKLQSLESLTARGKWPEGGLEEVGGFMESCESEFQTYVDNVSRYGAACLNRTGYNKFLDYLFSLFYTTSPQGRVQAFSVLNSSQIDELIDEGVVLTDVFKTAPTLSFQPVTLSMKCRKFLVAYRDVIRPLVLLKNGRSKGKGKFFIPFDSKAKPLRPSTYVYNLFFNNIAFSFTFSHRRTFSAFND